jgi:hypothetical protein
MPSACESLPRCRDTWDALSPARLRLLRFRRCAHPIRRCWASDPTAGEGLGDLVEDGHGKVRSGGGFVDRQLGLHVIAGQPGVLLHDAAEPVHRANDPLGCRPESSVRTGSFRKPTPGPPQGSNLSPLLSNIALAVLDEYLAQQPGGPGSSPGVRAGRLRRGRPNFKLDRYADEQSARVSTSIELAKQRTHLQDASRGVIRGVGMRLRGSRRPSVLPDVRMSQVLRDRIGIGHGPTSALGKGSQIRGNLTSSNKVIDGGYQTVRTCHSIRDPSTTGRPGFSRMPNDRSVAGRDYRRQPRTTSTACRGPESWNYGGDTAVLLDAQPDHRGTSIKGRTPATRRRSPYGRSCRRGVVIVQVGGSRASTFSIADWRRVTSRSDHPSHERPAQPRFPKARSIRVESSGTVEH